MARPYALRDINEEAFRELWMRPHISRERIARTLGVTASAVGQKAKALGLPPRTTSTKKGCDDLFRRMWLAGVATQDMAAYFGYAHRSCVTMRRRSMGLPPRQKGKSGKRNGGWVGTISLAEFLEMELARKLERKAG